MKAGLARLLELDPRPVHRRAADPAANDNPDSGAGAGSGPEARIEDAVMRLDRLPGRQMAREHFQQS